METARFRIEQMFRTKHLNESHDRLRSVLNARLDVLTSVAANASCLGQAMRYALLAPGKRIRPLLTIASAQRYGGSLDATLDVACAVEFVHAASLILDDLPCMDDAKVRRGRPATHVAFGESTALLASVGLLGMAFETVTSTHAIGPGARADIVRLLASAVGPSGLVGGQFADLAATTSKPSPDDVGQRHKQKTGALFAAAVESGARVAGADDAAKALMHAFGTSFGQAFQHFDDVLDATGSAELMGKDVRNDANRTTLVGLVGRDEAIFAASRHLHAAAAALNDGRTLQDPLTALFKQFFGLTI